jgi:hypothetical protein
VFSSDTKQEMEDRGETTSSSLDLALADVEILRSAYPDETSLDDTPSTAFPLHLVLHLSETAYIQLEWNEGYPVTSNVQVPVYRSKRPSDHARLEQAVAAVRITAASCLSEGVEGGLACCAAALDAFHSSSAVDQHDTTKIAPDPIDDDHRNGSSSLLSRSDGAPIPSPPQQQPVYTWMIGEPLVDRKSVFLAHLCRIHVESQVEPAIQQLLHSHSKYQRATHNMVRAVCATADDDL